MLPTPPPGALTDPAEIARRLDALSPEQHALLLKGLRAEALDRCGRDPLWYASFVHTRDEADPDNSTKPFPVHLDYVRRVVGVLNDPAANRIAIAKSRQMLVSWIMCMFCTYVARFRPNSLVVFQSQKDEDANAMVSMPGNKGEGGYSGRCQFIEQHLPSWLQQRVTCTEGAIDYPNGSRILALAGGANQVRGKTITLYVGDEFAFQTEAKSVYAATSPLVQKGAKFVAVSTPNGAEGSLMWHIYHGIPFE